MRQIRNKPFVVITKIVDIQKAIDLIEKAGHVAIILPPDADLDLLASAEALAGTLEEKGKTVGFLPADFKFPEKIIASPLFAKINVGSALPKEFIVSVDISGSPISQLRYEKNGSFLHIILSPQSSSLGKENVSFLEGKVKCDCALILGIQNIEALNGSPDAGPEFLSETPLINIDNSEKNQEFGEANLVNRQKTSLSEIAYEFITALRGEPISSQTATLLFSGVLKKTGSLRSPQASADTLLTASELMRLGASRNTAEILLSENAPLNLLQLFGRASVRSKLDEKLGILWSFVTSDDFEKTGSSPKDLHGTIERLEKEAPAVKLITLLWQDPESKNVSVTLAGNGERLEAVRSLAGGEFQSPYLLLEKTFKNFIDAEEYLNSLLGGTL